MATTTERFLAIIDAQTSGAIKNLTAFDKQVAKSNTEFDRFAKKIGVSSKTLKAGLAAAAASISFEVVARGILNASNAYAEAAKSAGDLAAATGGTVEEVSRMQAALRDAGVTSEKSAAMLTKFATAAGGKKGADTLRALNVELVRGQSGAVDYAATMTVAVDQIMALGDAAQRNTALVALFGRQGATAFQDMIASGASLADTMAAIDEARVFTAQDVANGRALDNAMDDMNASAERLTNTVGRGVVPAMVLVADTFNAASDAMSNVDFDPTILTAGLAPAVGVLSRVAQMLGVTADEAERLGDASTDTQTAMQALTATIASGATSGQAFADAVAAAGDELAAQDANARLAAQALDIYRASTDQAYESTLKLLDLNRSERSALRAAEGASDAAGDAKANMDKALADAKAAKVVVEKIAAIQGRARKKREEDGIVAGSVDVSEIPGVKGRKASTKTRVIEAEGVITPAEARAIREAARTYEQSLDDIAAAWERLGQERVKHKEALGLTLTEAEKLDEVRKALLEGLKSPGLSPKAKDSIKADLAEVEKQIKKLGGVPVVIDGVKFKPGTSEKAVKQLKADMDAAFRTGDWTTGSQLSTQLQGLKETGAPDLKVALGLDDKSVAATQAALANVGVDPKTGKPYTAKTIAKVDKTQAQKDLDALTKDRTIKVTVDLVPGTGGFGGNSPLTVPPVQGPRAQRLNFGTAQQVSFNPTVVNNYPLPERASDSVAASLRTAKYMVGA